MGVLTSALAIALVAGSATPAFACGCGAIVSPVDTKTTASNERAILSWNGKQEVMELSFDISSPSLVAGVIIPTPTEAELEAGDARTFDLLENLVAPEESYETDLWGLAYLKPQPEQTTVTVLDRVRIGELEASTLAASDSAGLTTWLAANEFEISEELTKSLDAYVELGWTFTVVKLVGEAPLDGRLDPVRLTFDTDRLIYPMRLAKLDLEPRDVRLYVFDTQRTSLAQAATPTRDLDADISVLWAGEVDDPRLKVLGPYLTVSNVHYEEPETQATSDIGVVPSHRTEDVQAEIVHYRTIALLGIPVGTLIVLWVAIGFGIVAAHLIGRRRAR